MKLDIKDKKLIYELSINCRQSVRELAKKLKLSKSTVSYRVQRLINEKIISGFKALIDYPSINENCFALYLKLQNTNKEIESEIINYLIKSKNVPWIGTSYGDWELIIEIKGKNFIEVSSVISDFYKKYSKYIQKKEIGQYIYQSFFGYKLTDIKDPKEIKTNYVGESKDLDEEEKKILELISKDPNYKLYNLAEKLSLSVDTLRKKISKLSQNGTMIGYFAKLNFPKVNRRWYILQITLRDYSYEKKFIEFLKNINEVHYIIRYLGAFDYEIGLHIEKSEELENILTEIKSNFPEMMQDYGFSFVNKVYKFE